LLLRTRNTSKGLSAAPTSLRCFSLSQTSLFLHSLFFEQSESACNSSSSLFLIRSEIDDLRFFEWRIILTANILTTCATLTVGALILIALSMVPKRFWLAAKATSKTPGFSVLSSPPDSKPDTVADIFKHNLNRNRRRWNIGFAVVASLVALILGLSLGLTVGRRHANNDGKLSSVVGGKLSSVVDLGYSRYQGIDLQNGVNQWLGIRYAAAPIGDLRFTAPQDPTPNSTVQKAAEVCFASLACPTVTDRFEAWPYLLG